MILLDFHPFERQKGWWYCSLWQSLMVWSQMEGGKKSNYQSTLCAVLSVVIFCKSFLKCSTHRLAGTAAIVQPNWQTELQKENKRKLCDWADASLCISEAILCCCLPAFVGRRHGLIALWIRLARLTSSSFSQRGKRFDLCEFSDSRRQPTYAHFHGKVYTKKLSITLHSHFILFRTHWHSFCTKL